MRRRWRWFYLAPLGILGVLLFIVIGGEIVMQLWNWLLPDLFGFREITFWQGLGILVLCRILFGGVGSHGGPRSKIRPRMEERWDAMTPEERERFRQGMRSRCGFGPSAGEGEPQAQ